MNSIDKYIGIPYKLGGRDMNALDCWGLVEQVYKNELGLELHTAGIEYHKSYLDRAKDFETERQKYISNWERIDSNKRKDFDVIIFTLTKNGLAYHAGICFGDNVLHTEKIAMGVVLERLDRFRYWEVYRYSIKNRT